MTAIGEKAAGNVARESTGLGQYLGVGILALALGVGAVLGAIQITSAPAGPSPAQVAEIRAAVYVDYLEAQWLAQVHNQRAGAMVDRFAGAHTAGLAAIQDQRAQDMVDRFAGQHAGQLGQVHEQRAQAMVDHKFGAGSIDN